MPHSLSGAYGLPILIQKLQDVKRLFRWSKDAAIQNRTTNGILTAVVTAFWGKEIPELLHLLKGVCRKSLTAANIYALVGLQSLGKKSRNG